jgi:hypothetical protein
MLSVRQTRDLQGPAGRSAVGIAPERRHASARYAFECVMLPASTLYGAGLEAIVSPIAEGIEASAA